ncbi:scaffolding protein [Streptomyces phage phiRKBJ001]|nr:scaffolding protein [Streptomyces phage phiRKBJ001]
MNKPLLRPGIQAVKSARAGLDLITAAGVDGYEPGWAHPYSSSDPFMPWHADGGEDDDKGEEDEEDDKEEEDDDEEDDDEDDEDKGKTPEELAAEVKRLRAAYLKKLKNSKNRGTRLTAAESAKAELERNYATLQEQFEELKKTAGKEVDSEAAQRRINELVEKAKEEGREAFKPTVIRMAARAELMAAGARPALVDRLVRMIDVGEVDIDDEDGTIDVTDQVDALKKDMPEMFGPKRATTKRTTRKSGSGDGSDKGTGSGKGSARKAGGSGGGDEGAGEEKLTAAQKVANRLRGL